MVARGPGRLGWPVLTAMHFLRTGPIVFGKRLAAVDGNQRDPSRRLTEGESISKAKSSKVKNQPRAISSCLSEEESGLLNLIG